MANKKLFLISQILQKKKIQINIPSYNITKKNLNKDLFCVIGNNMDCVCYPEYHIFWVS